MLHFNYGGNNPYFIDPPREMKICLHCLADMQGKTFDTVIRKFKKMMIKKLGFDCTAF